MLNKGARAVAGEYLRLVWKVYRPLLCSTAAVEKTLKEKIWANTGYLLVSLSGGYKADVNNARDFETWEAILRVGRSQPTVTYGAIITPLESFNGTFACSTISDAFQLVASEKVASAQPGSSLAQTVADATTQQAETEREENEDRLDNAIGTVKILGYGAIAVSLAYIASKLTGIIK
jgi:hypothetical protein